VVADTTLGGTDLPAGSRLLLLWGAANRDPAQFDAPNDFRLDRPGGNAADLFAERGPAATSIRDIAARSRVNHGLIHRHFGGKDALVGAVLDHLGQHLAGLLDAKADGERPCEGSR
jgi:hypothetical protein